MSRFSTLLILAGVCSSTLQAQYDIDREYTPPNSRFLNVGFVQRDFQPRSSNPGPDSIIIRYDRLMPMIGYRQGMVDLTFGYTGYTLHGRSRSIVYFGATVANEFPIMGGRNRTALLLPLLLSADYTKAEGAGPASDDFNVASAGVGGGFKVRYQAPDLSLWIQLVEIAHFSTEGFGAGSGFSAATVGEVVVLARHTLVFDGLAFGYRYRLQTWSMSEHRFNYRTIAHGPFVGVLF